MAKRINEIRRYAVVGAEQRLLELAEEARRIFQAFPELRRKGRGFDAGGVSTVKRPVRRRRKMSAEARRRISEAQKTRWAKRREGGRKKK